MTLKIRLSKIRNFTRIDICRILNTKVGILFIFWLPQYKNVLEYLRVSIHLQQILILSNQYINTWNKNVVPLSMKTRSMKFCIVKVFMEEESKKFKK